MAKKKRQLREDEIWEQINDSNYQNYLGGRIGTKDSSAFASDIDVLRKEAKRKQQEEINNRSKEDWKKLRDVSESKLLDSQNALAKKLSDNNINARVQGKKVIANVNKPDGSEVGNTFNNNLEKQAKNNTELLKYMKTDEAKDLQKEISKNWDERAYNISGYETKKAKDDSKELNTISKILMTPIQGATSMLSSLRGDLTTEKGRLQSYNEAILDENKENAKTGIGKLGYTILSEIGKQSAVQGLNKVIPGLGTTTYFVDIADDQYNNAIKQGYTHEQARNFAVLSTAGEALFERFLGAGSNFFKGKKGAENVISNTLSKFVKNKTANDLLSAFISEGSEEFLEEYLGEFNRQLTLDEKIDTNKIFFEEGRLKNAWESFIVGGITGSYGATMQRLTTPKDISNYNQALYTLENENGKLSNANKTILKNMLSISEELNIPMNSEQMIDNFNNIKKAQINNFQNSALELFPNLDENSRVEYNKLINDISELIYDTGMNVKFDPNLDVVSEVVDNNIVINPTMTSTPIKTLLLKELSTKLLDLDTKKAILSNAKENGLYDTLKQQLIDSGNFDEINVDDEIVAYELNRIFDNQEELNKISKQDSNFISNVKDLVDSLVAKITNNRTTKDSLFLKELGNKLNISNELINNELSGKELSNRETENIERMENEEETTQVKSNELKNNEVIKETTNKEGKTRKAYDTMQKSDNFTDEEKKTAKHLKELDTYIPDSNEAQLKRADERISKNGLEKSYDGLKDAIENDRKINQDDIAVAERALEYYRNNGTKEQIEDALMTTAMAGTIAGRSLQAMKLIYKMSPEGQTIWIQRSIDKLNKELKKFNKNTKQEFTFTDDMKNTILNSSKENLEENVNKVCQELGDQITMNVLQKLDTWRYFAMLSSPTTHARNILGNFGMGKMQNVKNTIKGGIEDIYYGATGKDGERTATLRKTDKKYVEYAKNDLKNVDKQLGTDESKYKESSNKIKDNMRMFRNDFLEKYVHKGVIKFVENKLTQEDVYGLEKAYVKAMSQYLNANKIDLNKITDQELSRARAYAVDQAKQATFHQDNAIASAINTIENQNLFTKVAIGGVVPFKKTPLNVAATSLRYNPVGLLWTLTGDTVRLNMGQITVNEYIDNISKGLTGTGIALLGFALANAGIIRTTGDDDEDYSEDKGIQPYSIVIGDKTISLDWLSPTAVPLFVGAELNRQIENILNDVPVDQREGKFIALTGLIEAGVSSLNPVSEMTMLSGVQNALKSYDKNYAKAFSQIGTNIVKNYASQVVPSIWSKVARITDDYERSTTSTKTGTVEKAVDQFVNQIKSKSIILRKTLPVKTDVWGNEVKQESNVLKRAALNLASPAIVKDVRHTALDDEIERLYKATGEKSVMPKTYIDKKLTYNNKDYQLTNSEYALYKKTLGQMNYKNLNELINSPEYKKLNDIQKAEIMENIYKFDKDGVIKVAYAKAKNISYEDTTYKTAKEVVSLGGNVGDYYLYQTKVKDIKGDDASYKKNKELKDMDISNNSKSAIYESRATKSTLDLYKILKESNVNINDYLDYLSNEFKADKKANGDTISGSKKTKEFNYMNNNSNLTYEQKLLILSRNYSFSNSEKTYIANRINNSNLSNSEKLELYKSINGFKVLDNGMVRW